MTDQDVRSPIPVRHPSPAASLPARGRTPAPFFECLATPVRLAWRDASEFEPAGDPVHSGHAYARHAGSLWRSLSVQAYVGGPRTAVDAAEFAAFLERPERFSLLGPLLRHTPLAASRPLLAQPPRPPFEVDRGGPPPDGHRVVAHERERSERLLRGFLAGDVLVTGDRVYRRVQPAVAVGETVTLALVPDPAIAHGFLLPIDGYGEAVRATRQRPPSRAEMAQAERLEALGGDEEAVLCESVNLLGRSIRRFLDGLRLNRIDPPDLRARIRDRIGAHGGAWQARSMIGGIDLAEGEVLLDDAASAEDDIQALAAERQPPRPGFGPVLGRAATLLMPILRRGAAPDRDDLDALSSL